MLEGTIFIKNLKINHLKKGDIIMESKVLDSVLRGAGVRREPVDEIQTGDRKRGTEEGYGSKEVELKKIMMPYPGTETH